MCQRTAHMQAQWQLDAHRLFPRRSRNCAHQDDTNVAGHCLGLWTASSLHDARVPAASRPRHPSCGLCTDAFCADVFRPRTLWCGFLLFKYIAILRQSYVSKWHMRVFFRLGYNWYHVHLFDISQFCSWSIRAMSRALCIYVLYTYIHMNMQPIYIYMFWVFIGGTRVRHFRHCFSFIGWWVMPSMFNARNQGYFEHLPPSFRM